MTLVSEQYGTEYVQRMQHIRLAGAGGYLTYLHLDINDYGLQKTVPMNIHDYRCLPC